ncbi:uncharacterized protein LOC106737762 [Alligator mississippiensis]|uniref:uncharacterized protein LOC106737762 n=1 Tax=Alligator mississippiensis TaxID=8496 RepID=UPI0007118AEF|nr:uncharacterized protein LOC106737762 [Alligator mississippiensis]
MVRPGPQRPGPTTRQNIESHQFRVPLYTPRAVMKRLIVLILSSVVVASVPSTDSETSNSILSLLSVSANMTGSNDTSGLTACLKLPLSVADPVLDPIVYPLNVSAWFQARNGAPQEGANLTFPSAKGPCHHTYFWSVNITLNAMGQKGFSRSTIDPSSGKRSTQQLLGSEVPWGIPGEGVDWQRPDNSLRWYPKKGWSPPWYLALPPDPSLTTIDPNVKTSGPPPFGPSPLLTPNPITTWNASLAVDVSDNTSWYSYYYPILRAARISQWCHNLSAASPNPNAVPGELHPKAWAGSARCKTISTPALVGLLWACSDGHLYTMLPGTLSGVQCFLVMVVLCPPVYASTARLPTPMLRHRMRRGATWSSLTDEGRSSQALRWILEGTFLWGGLSIGKARIAIAQLAEQVEHLVNDTTDSFALINQQLQATSQMTMQNLSIRCSFT